MFIQGDIVKSKLRTEEYPYFVMVLLDRNPDPAQFNGVVLFCKSSSDTLNPDEKTGYVTNTWNTLMWEKSSWEELKKWI